ncbi:caltractin-like isoform X3 [Orbicella faveolata]|uniref:caltractin-like isoform X3 n=3 Tax=Orbicella faveolata TaxID=48498 RepID=UPI0009E36022|nr:caltractin-like isoform X3 [Orbicella faveolata]
MPKKAGKKKGKKKTSKSADDRESSLQLGNVPNKTMVQQMASETLSVAGSSRSGISSRERLSQALFDGELRNKRRFMKGKVTSRAYEQLTPQEIRDLKLVFDVFDTDKSGSIDARELRKAMRALGFKISRESIEDMIADLDIDKSGSIEFDEFLEFIIARQGDGRDVHNEIVQGFKMFDTDKTGKISLTNLKQVSRLCGVKLNEQELKEMIQEADKDGDSEVDQEEFVNIMLKTNLFSS